MLKFLYYEFLRLTVCKIFGHKFAYYDRETAFNGVSRIIYCPRCLTGLHRD